MEIQKIQRYAVWGAILALGYLIMLQWDEDFHGDVKSALQTTPSPALMSDAPFVENYDVIENKGVENEDMPSVSTNTTNIADVQVTETPNSDRYLKINTDVLSVFVDLKGGDIVQVNLNQHKKDIDQVDIPLTLLQQDAERLYIAQSGLVGTNGPDASSEGRPLYRVEHTTVELNNEDEIRVPLFFTTKEGVKITKEFVLRKGDYLLDVNYKIDNQSNTTWKGNVFAQLKRDNTIDPLADTSPFAMKPFLGMAYWSPEKNYNKVSMDDLEDEPIKLTATGGWASFVQHYFISAWVAPVESKNNYSSRVNSKGENIFGFTSEGVVIPSGERNNISIGFYAGPKDQKRLEKISKGLELTVDYGWLWMVAQVLFAILIKIQSYVGNWGWSIVLLTVSVKAFFFPLNHYAFKSMANMRKLQPEMARLKELYGDDRQKLSQATMEMYRKEKINPLGSCLPMLVQMPVFIALYWTLSESVEIRHAPFIFYIEDLTVKDPYFILPILMAVSMFLQQKISPMVFNDPMQERVMKMMPIMFSVFFLFFPAGLVLYWFVNNLLTISQQWIINKSIEKNSK